MCIVLRKRRGGGVHKREIALVVDNTGDPTILERWSFRRAQGALAMLRRSYVSGRVMDLIARAAALMFPAWLRIQVGGEKVGSIEARMQDIEHEKLYSAGSVVSRRLPPTLA